VVKPKIMPVQPLVDTIEPSIYSIEAPLHRFELGAYRVPKIEKRFKDVAIGRFRRHAAIVTVPRCRGVSSTEPAERIIRSADGPSLTTNRVSC